jgi:hypothetical protein
MTIGGIGNSLGAARKDPADENSENRRKKFPAAPPEVMHETAYNGYDVSIQQAIRPAVNLCAQQKNRAFNIPFLDPPGQAA